MHSSEKFNFFPHTERLSSSKFETVSVHCLHQNSSALSKLTGTLISLPHVADVRRT